MERAAAFARWIRRCWERVWTADRHIIESDLHDLTMTTRTPGGRADAARERGERTDAAQHRPAPPPEL